MTDLFPPNLSQRPGAYPVAPPVPGLVCRFCGNGPAAQTTFRKHTGMILVMRFASVTGPFCRDCGLYAFRSTTAHTLLAGWWGYASMVIAPVTILINLFRRSTVANLPAAQPMPGGRAPADPGKPLYQRPAILGVLLPVLVIGLIVLAASTDANDPYSPYEQSPVITSTPVITGSGIPSVEDVINGLAGKCVNRGGGRLTEVDCAGPHDAEVVAVTDGASCHGTPLPSRKYGVLCIQNAQ
ncbi:hypothetical protein [Hamadaea tsunoensis]|uniref:hypothetical protein n=1 Tax=Hamadaea tsunoensis TaxID=53368 RepID=UPI00041DC3A4|nr:hypothetical protein [Hamadaea tsunoensis]